MCTVHISLVCERICTIYIYIYIVYSTHLAYFHLGRFRRVFHDAPILLLTVVTHSIGAVPLAAEQVCIALERLQRVWFALT